MADLEETKPVHINPDSEILTPHEQAIIEEFFKSENKKYGRFTLAALGAVPWVGGVLGAVAALDSELSQRKVNDLMRLWVREHQEKIALLSRTIQEILTRLDALGDEIKKRIESPEYLALVRKGFRAWDLADTPDKRDMYKRLISNAGASTLCPDDWVHLFISWIEQYHESHFMVIKTVYKHQPITRGRIWDIIHAGGRPSDSSSEAGLFAFLIRDLRIGGVIHNEREINSDGSYVKQRRLRRRSTTSSTMESPFEDTKPMMLTELGKEFVHYVMDDVLVRVGSESTSSENKESDHVRPQFS